MLLLGVPVAIGSCIRAHQEARDRGYVRVAVVACVVAIVLCVAELAIPGGVVRHLLPLGPPSDGPSTV
jgi:hypothetical protein